MNDAPMAERAGGRPAANGPCQLVHIGQRKTGTTWLQGTLAAAATRTGTFSFQHESVKAWTRANSRKAAEDADWKGLTALLSEWRDKNVSVSLEALISFDHERMSAALVEALPRAIVLVTTRSPTGRMQSGYAHVIRAGHPMRPEKYIRKFLESRKARSNDLKAVAGAYGKAFGRELVRFVPYELLRDDQPAFLDEVSRLCGVHLGDYVVAMRNPRPPDFYLALLRRVGEQLSALDRDWADSEECKTFLKISSHSTAFAKELWGSWERRLAELKLTFERPELPPEALAEFNELNSPLRDLPLYRPYLAEYGFAE